MEAQLTMASVKMLTKNLTCLARYSDEMDILALPNSLTLSATNAAKSAYCRLQLQSTFFSSYSLRRPPAGTGSSFRSANTQAEEARSVKARLKTKLLLSHLRHKNHEKGVRSVKLIIREPPPDGAVEDGNAEDESDEEEGSRESVMLVKFFCDHGVVKQHRLVLDYPEELLAPHVDDEENQKIVVASKPALRSLLERIRVGVTKADGQIECRFNPADMVVQMMAEKREIFTEIKMDGTDLVRYETGATSVCLSFHVREFSATLALAESLDKHLKLTFTEPPAPIILDISPIEPDENEPDNWDFQAFIATSGAVDFEQGHGAKRTRASNNARPAKVARVTRENSPEDRASEQRQPVQPELRDAADAEQQMGFDADNGDFPPPVPSPPPRHPVAPSQRQFHVPPSQAGPSGTYNAANRASAFRGSASHNNTDPPHHNHNDKEEPLFLPASQLSQAARQEIYEQTGMELNDEDLEGFWDVDDDEIEQNGGGQNNAGGDEQKVSVAEQSIAFGPTLPQDNGRPFQALFGNSMLDTDEPEVTVDQQEDEHETVYAATQPRPGAKQFRALFDD